MHGEREIYTSEWMSLHLADVEIPGGARFEHHVLRMPFEAAGTLVHDPDRGLLLLWRHRFITDNWGWEVPAGRIEADETPAQAAERECLEETGWRPGPLEPLVDYDAAHGATDHHFNIFLARGATYVGEPTDPGESERVEWLLVDRVRDEIAAGRMPDGLSLTAVLYALAFGRI